jgi:hypothetical protein
MLWVLHSKGIRIGKEINQGMKERDEEGIVMQQLMLLKHCRRGITGWRMKIKSWRICYNNTSRNCLLFRNLLLSRRNSLLTTIGLTLLNEN